MEEALESHLAGDAAVAALVAGRISPVSRAQGSGLPAITYQKITGGPLYVDSGEAGLREDRVQIDCWAETFASAKAVARAVTAALSALRDTVNGVNFRTVMLDTEQDLRERGTNAPEYLYRTRLDFIIWHDS